jgi:endoglucanase Acf2
MKFTIATVVGLLLVHTSSALDSSPLNRDRTVILNQRSKGSSGSTPMYRIIKPISADSPPETFPVITHPFPPIYASKDAKAVVPTNSWFSNLFYPSVENLAPTTPDPYILRFLDDFDGTRGLSISQPDEKVKIWQNKRF